jgi:uncharacterized sulfatase
MFQTPTTRRWRELYDQGKLNAAQRQFWETKPPEELYDLRQDPDEVRNLASSPAHQDILRRLRREQQSHARRIRDLGFLPECELHSRARNSTPCQVGRDDRLYPLDRIMAAAEAASRGESLPGALRDPDSAVRYWGAMSLLMRGQAGPPLRKALADPAPAVRIAAAEALGRYGDPEDLQPALKTLLDLADAARSGAHVSLMALNALDALGEKAAPVRSALPSLQLDDPNAHARFGGYTRRIVQYLAP